MKVLSSKYINRAEWSKLVASSATGTWFQTPEAYEFYASQPGLFNPFVLGVENDQSPITNDKSRLRAVCVGYVTVEKNPIKQFFTRRAIIIGGPCLADDCTDEEVTTLMNALKNYLSSVHSFIHSLVNSPIYIETRNFNDYSRWKRAFERAGFEYQPHLNFHVDTSSVEIVDKNVHKSRKRDIKTSIRDGVTIVDSQELIGKSQELEQRVHEFYLILKNLYKTKVKTPLFPESFFHALAKHPDARFLLTELDGKIIGGTVNVGMKEKCLYEWFACGKDGEWKTIFPSSVATYAGIRYAAEHDMPRFDMMGAGKPGAAYGVRDFKAKFGGKEVEHGRYIYVARPLLFQIGEIGVTILKKLK